MIYQRHLAQCREGLADAREFSVTPYENLGNSGILNVVLNKSLHIIDEGNSTFGVYPDPNFLGSAKPNELRCAFSTIWHNAPTGIPNTAQGTAGTTTLKLFDDAAGNYVNATVTQTVDRVATLSFGVNGSPSVTVTLTPRPHSSRFCVSLGAVNGLAYVMEPTTLSGFCYTASLPEGWSHGRHTGQIQISGPVEVNGLSLIETVAMRTAAYDWGSPGMAGSGVKPLQDVNGFGAQKSGNGSISPRLFGTRYADFGGVAEGTKHDLFLDAAPYGYYSSAPATHLSAIEASQTQALFVPVYAYGLPNLQGVTSGTPNITLTAAGNVPNLLSGTTSYNYFLTGGLIEENPRAIFFEVRETELSYLENVQLPDYYSDTPADILDLGNYKQFSRAQTTEGQVSNIRMRAYLKNPESTGGKRDIAFSQGVTAQVSSAGASRLQAESQDLSGAYYSEPFDQTSSSSFCFFDVLYEVGDSTSTTTTTTYRKLLGEPVLEEKFATSGASLGFVWRVYTEGWEVYSTIESTVTQQTPAIAFNTGTQSIVSAKAGNPFTSSYGTIALT